MPRILLLLSTVALLSASCSLYTQTSRLGVQVQAYPSGIIPGIQIQHAWHDDDVFFTSLAANITDRQDDGEHDNEEGDGFGLGFGYRKYQNTDRTGWLYGARADFWNLTIDWRDNAGPTSGSTDVLIFQPTVEAGYAWLLGDGSWSLDLSAGLGAEINLDEDGEEVGDGAILLVGFTFLYNG